MCISFDNWVVCFYWFCRETHSLEAKVKKIRKSLVIVVFIVLAGYFLRVENLGYQPAWSDETDVILFSIKPSTTLLFELGKPGHNGPLYYLLVHNWFELVGSITFTLRYLSVVFGVLSVAVAYQFGRKMLGQWSGIGFSLFIATSPYLVWYSQDGKMYSLLLFISLLAMTLLVNAGSNAKYKRVNLFAFISLSGASFYLHLVSIILLPVYGYVIYVNKRAKSLISVVFILASLIILSFPIVKWVLPLWLSPFQTGHEYFQFQEILGIQLLGFSAGVPFKGQIISAGVFMFLFVLGMSEAMDFDLNKLILPVYFFIPIILLYLISLGMPFYTDRYLIFTAPAFYALCIVGLKRIGIVNVKIAIGVMSIAILLNLIAIVFQSTAIIKPSA